MSVKGIRRMLVGEKMPDKDDPKYRERYEKELEAGRRFARATRIDRAAAKVQGFANAHKTLFLAAVFGFVASCLGLNVYRLARYCHSRETGRTATEMQDSVLKARHQQIIKGENRQ